MCGSSTTATLNVIQFQYTGYNMAVHSQSAGNVVIVGDPKYANGVTIKAGASSSAYTQAYAGVYVGSTFQITFSTFPTTLTLLITTSTGTALSHIAINTACTTEPLYMKNVFGSLKVIGYTRYVPTTSSTGTSAHHHAHGLSYVTEVGVISSAGVCHSPVSSSAKATAVHVQTVHQAPVVGTSKGSKVAKTGGKSKGGKVAKVGKGKGKGKGKEHTHTVATVVTVATAAPAPATPFQSSSSTPAPQGSTTGPTTAARIAPPSDNGYIDGELAMLELEYTGGNEMVHQQPSEGVSVDGDPNYANSIKITARDTSTSDGFSLSIDRLQVGGRFQINLPEFPTKLQLMLWNDANDDVLLSTVEFQIEPLFLNDLFGSVRVVGYTTQSGESGSADHLFGALSEGADSDGHDSTVQKQRLSYVSKNGYGGNRAHFPKFVVFMVAGVRCAPFDGILHSRMPLVPTPARLKRTCVWPMAFLSGVHFSYRFAP
jgi:hypothetical protein